jgi:hypothetical protein
MKYPKTKFFNTETCIDGNTAVSQHYLENGETHQFPFFEMIAWYWSPQYRNHELDLFFWFVEVQLPANFVEVQLPANILWRMDQPTPACTSGPN